MTPQEIFVYSLKEIEKIAAHNTKDFVKILRLSIDEYDDFDDHVEDILSLDDKYDDATHNFHKAFRQRDCSQSSNLDMIIWIALQHVDVTQIFKFLCEHKHHKNLMDEVIKDVLLWDYLVDGDL